MKQLSQKREEEQDELRIKFKNLYQVEYWTVRFDVTTVKFRAAINAVGNVATAVETYFQKRTLGS